MAMAAIRALGVAHVNCIIREACACARQQNARAGDFGAQCVCARVLLLAVRMGFLTFQLLVTLIA